MYIPSGPETPIFEILGLLFDLWRTKANNTFNYWVEILREMLPVSQILPNRRGKKR